MDNEPEDTFGHKITFNKSNDSDRQSQIKTVLNEIRAVRPQAIENDLRENLHLRQKTLSLTEQKKITNFLRIATQRMKDLDLENWNTLLPKAEQIIFTESEEQSPTGDTSLYGDYFRIDIPEGMDIENPEVKRVFFHELAHYITKVVIKTDRDNPTIDYASIAGGFDPISTVPDEQANIYPPDRGVFQEPLAELFALYCLDDESHFVSPYFGEVSFMVEFLKKYAVHEDISPLEAFKRVFKANAERNYGIFRTFVSIFGKEGMKAANNFQKRRDFEDKLKQMVDVVTLRCGIQNEFITHMLAGEVQLNGLKGTFVLG